MEGPPEHAGETPRARLAPAAAQRPAALWLGALLVAALTAACFWPAAEHAFLDYDDVVYVTGNEAVRGGLDASSLAWALTATDTAANWHPLTWLVHMLDVELFGLDPSAHHRASVLWHALAAALLLVALVHTLGPPRRGWTLAAALLAALLWALHPLRVEAVAMVADRKDAVAAACALLSLWFWTGWLQRGRRRSWIGALGAFALALASKPTVLPWPAVLWLVGRGMHGGPERAARTRANGRALLPFWLLAAAAAWPVLLAQSGAGSLEAAGALGAGERIVVAAAAVYEYGLDTLRPSELAFFYPHPAMVGAPLPVGRALGGMALILGGWACAHRVRTAWPELGVGLLACLVLLLPTLGLFQFGMQARADRYTYLPSVGLAFALAGGLGRLGAARTNLARASFAGLALLVLLAARDARRQLGTWRDTVTVASHALKVTDHNFMAHTLLAGQRYRAGQLAPALDHYAQALALRPAAPGMARTAATLALRLDRAAEARHLLELAVRTNPEDGASRRTLATLALGAQDEAGARLHVRALWEDAAQPPELRRWAGPLLAWLLLPEDPRDATRVAAASLALGRTVPALEALAATRAAEDRFEEAVALLDEALALLPSHGAEAATSSLESQRSAYQARRPWTGRPWRP